MKSGISWESINKAKILKIFWDNALRKLIIIHFTVIKTISGSLLSVH